MIEISDKKLCSGCHACYNACPTNAIEMKEDENGFKYPIVDKEKCINCGLCEKRCPIINKKEIKNEPKIYVCYNKDENIRMKSSSGGIFTLIAEEILNRKGVVFGVAFNNDFSCSHIMIENKEDLNELRTSKYFQSSVDNTYKKAKEILEQDRYVLYTGTPCQIEGLLAFLNKKYDKLYTQDIVCHGVPSPKVWKKYLEYRKKIDGEEPTQINFRDKKQEGWHLFSLSFKYKDTEYAQNQKKDIFMKAFLRDVCLRESCYSCIFRKKHRLSDITLADCWGIKKIKPEFDDDKGTSIIMVNSEKGKELFEIFKNSINYFETTMENAIMSNPAIIKSPAKNKNREKFFSNINKMDFDKLVKKYVPDPSFFRRCVRKVKRVIKKVLKRH
jgi:coenzyme F420-reducing hydrogenase beta subunit